MQTLVAPAKHFVLGEYAILEGGTALLFTHAPYFELHIDASQNPALIGIHPESPAGRFYQTHKTIFSRHHLTFTDPYQEAGGLGASSAQFVLLYKLYLQLTEEPFYLKNLLQVYKKFSWSGQGYAPSGADVVAQTMKGFCSWSSRTNEVINFVWSFTDCTFHFIHPRHKTKTHEHLETLQLNFALDKFHATVQQALSALAQHDSALFCDAINIYAALLKTHSLTTEHTLSLLENLKREPWVKAAKGCGAMGSDVLFIVIKNTITPALQRWAEQHNLQPLT